MSTAPAGPESESGVPRCYRHPHREATVRCTRCDRPICPDCMHDAAVGFHCPDDIDSARRSRRQPRTSVGAVLRDAPPYVTGVLLALNVAAYLATALASPRDLNHPSPSGRLFQDWQLLPYLVFHEGSYYRLITSGFLHVSLLHIGANMLSLFFLGPPLERLLGRWRFTALYLLSTLGGSVVIYAFGSPLVAVVGASGAIFGLAGACLVLVRRLGFDLQWLLAVIVLNFVFTFSVSGISKLGHIGGFLTGGLVALALVGDPRRGGRLTGRSQALGLTGLLVVLVAITAVRSATGTF